VANLKCSPAKLRQLSAYLQAGKDISECAHLLKVSRVTIYAWQARIEEKRHGGKPRRGRPPKGSAPPSVPSDGTSPPAFDPQAILARALASLEGLETELADSRNLTAKSRLPNVLRAVGELVKQLRSIEPPSYPSPEEIEARSRPDAAKVVARLREGVERFAALERELGRCARCGHALVLA
jgi:hypothetical protein